MIAQAPFTHRQNLDPLLTFDTLLVGPYNRFAHAAATSVVTSPGTMYNPLFLYGAPGVGKTHFMQSVAKGLSGPLGEGGVVLTSGMRLSQAVSQALTAGAYNTLKKSLTEAKALIVDDVHLIAVTDQNRSALAEIFGHFFSNNLQVVLSSLYPARALGGLEEALKISLSKGWAVDLKVPSPMVQVDILQGWLDRRGCQLNTDDTRLFHERIGTGYADAQRWMRRLLALVKLGQQRGQEQKPVELLNLLFDPGVTATDLPNEAELARTRGFQPPPAAEGAMPLALVVPKGAEAMATWVAAGFHSAQTQFGIAQTYKHVLLQAYDASQPFGVPFQVADACHRAGARAVIVVGPPNDTPLAAKASEFSHAVIHALGSLSIACGWIGHRGTMAPANYLRAHLDFAAERG